MASRLFSLALVGMLLLIGCDSSGDESESPDPLLPLKIGNEWTYRAPLENSEGTTIRGGALAKWEVAGEVTASGKEYYAVEVTCLNCEPEEELELRSEFFFRTAESGVYLAVEEGTGFSIEERMFLKFPAQSGDLYDFTTTSGNEVSISVERESVSTPAGSFECYQYQVRDVEAAEDEPAESSFCLSPGTGITRGQEDGDETLLLESFSLN